ncbi:hypothetical protein IT575_02830 [bacterium]|nr:hypothetical protein [bacterium]
MWICPRCGRQFKQETREHSCEVYTIEDHLKSVPEELRRLYLDFESALKHCGPVSVTALKSMIVFRRESNFAAVALRRDRLRASMLLPGSTPASLRFVSSKPYGRKLHVEFDLRDKDELDDELRAWMQQAYDLAAPAA